MQVMFTDAQVSALNLVISYHDARIFRVGGNEKAALSDMLDGYELRPEQLGYLCDFFGRMMDYAGWGDNLQIEYFVTHMFTAIKKEQRRLFNI